MEEKITMEITIKELYYMISINLMTIDHVITNILIESTSPLVNIITHALLKLSEKYWEWEIEDVIPPEDTHVIEFIVLSYVIFVYDKDIWHLNDKYRSLFYKII